MRNNIFLGLVLGVLSMFGVGNNSRAHTINQKDKALLQILYYRHLYMTGTARVESDSFLATATRDLPGGDMNKRIEHLYIHGVKPGSTREAALRLAERYLVSH